MANDGGGSQEKAGVHPGSGQQPVSLTDYIGVKEMLRRREEELSQVQQSLETLTGTHSESQARVVELETEVKNLGGQIETLRKSAVDPAQLARLTTERDQANVQILQLKRDIIVETYGISPDVIKDKTTEQLASFVDGLKAGGQVKGRKAPGADAGSGGGAGSVPQTARDKIHAGWEELHPK